MTFIVHQSDCLSTHPNGVDEVIYAKYPWSNIHTLNETRVPGTICVMTDDSVWSRMGVISLFGQYDFRPLNLSNETRQQRFEWFKQGLKSIYDHVIGYNEYVTINFIDHIGCGSAGGNWPEYKAEINKLSQAFKDDGYNHIFVNIIKPSKI